MEVEGLHAWPTDGLTVGAWIYRECADEVGCGGALIESDGLQLSKVVRRIDTREARAAYDAYRSRERRERGVRE